MVSYQVHQDADFEMKICMKEVYWSVVSRSTLESN